MTHYNFGDIILIGFPHTDLESISKRPALIIYDGHDNDIIVARITSQEYTADTDYKIKDWKAAGLLLESVIRVSKIATLRKNLVIRKLGSLNKNEIEDVKNIIVKMLSVEGKFV